MLVCLISSLKSSSCILKITNMFDECQRTSAILFDACLVGVFEWLSARCSHVWRRQVVLDHISAWRRPHGSWWAMEPECICVWVASTIVTEWQCFEMALVYIPMSRLCFTCVFVFAYTWTTLFFIKHHVSYSPKYRKKHGHQQVKNLNQIQSPNDTKNRYYCADYMNI